MLTLGIVLLLLQISEGLQKTAVLSLEDGANEEVYVRLEASQFKLYIYNGHFATDPLTVFCARERTVQLGKNNKCELVNLFGSYTCWHILGTFPGGQLNVQASTFTSDHTLTSTTLTGQTAVANSSITIGVSQVSIDLDPTIILDNKIYEVYAGYVVNLRGGSVFTKNAFFNTFRLSSQTASDDLMMPRTPHCF